MSDDIPWLLSELSRMTAEAEAQRAEVERLKRERDEALMLTESCSTLKDMAAVCIEGAKATADLERMREAAGPVIKSVEIVPMTVPSGAFIAVSATDIRALAAAARTEKEEGNG